MPKPIVGLHHVTAIASDPQTNLDFYTEVLGLRFVKRTVNFDDPGSYHFYFGDDSGTPGTILTFFPWPRTPRGSAGVGEVTLTAFSAPSSSIDFWENRLSGYNLPVERSAAFRRNRADLSRSRRHEDRDRRPCPCRVPSSFPLQRDSCGAQPARVLRRHLVSQAGGRDRGNPEHHGLHKARRTGEPLALLGRGFGAGQSHRSAREP